MGKYKDKAVIFDRVCAYSKCGNNFSVDIGHISQKYCTKKCQQKANYKYKAVEVRKDSPTFKCNCVCCGIEFISGRKNGIYCSYKCRQRHYVPPPGKLKIGICLNCNKEHQYTGAIRKYCSVSCAVNYDNRNLFIFDSNGVKTHKKCSKCNDFLSLSMFRIKDKFGTLRSACLPCENKSRNESRDPIKDRIKSKKWQSEKGWIGKSCKIFIKTCEYSGALFVTRSKGQKISDSSKFLIRMTKIIKSNKCDIDRHDREQEKLKCNCIECGNEIIYNKYIAPKFYLERKVKPAYCSKLCSKKNLKRKARSSRKAKEKKAFIENVDPLLVFKKHNWHCANCGCNTPKELRGTYSDFAPELDHIIPISRGGKHKYSNVQLLCRKCNANKSNKIINICQDQSMNLQLF